MCILDDYLLFCKPPYMTEIFSKPDQTKISRHRYWGRWVVFYSRRLRERQDWNFRHPATWQAVGGRPQSRPPRYQSSRDWNPSCLPSQSRYSRHCAGSVQTPGLTDSKRHACHEWPGNANRRTFGSPPYLLRRVPPLFRSKSLARTPCQSSKLSTPKRGLSHSRYEMTLDFESQYPLVGC